MASVYPRVVVAVPTYRRPHDLTRLLTALPPVIDRAVQSGLCASVDVLVIDNDGDAAETAASAGVPVRYVREERRGLAAVRNRALDEALDDDILVFIDDDETPAEESWLERLLAAQQASRAGVVAGPVRTVVPGGLDPWIIAGGFYDRSHRGALRSLDPIGSAASNNLLLRLDDVRRTGVRFDERFGRSGGEDSLFTAQLHAAGVPMVWCADAAVLDHLPAERRTREHALARSRGMEAAGARVAAVLAGRSRPRRAYVRARAVAIGSARLVVGSSRRVVGRLTGSIRRDASGARDVARGLGAWEGAVGRSRHLYGGDRATRTAHATSSASTITGTTITSSTSEREGAA